MTPTAWYAAQLEKRGDLTPAEAARLADYECASPPRTLTQQVERYSLLLKMTDPGKTDRLKTEIRKACPAIDNNDCYHDEKTYVRVASVLGRYFPGFSLNTPHGPMTRADVQRFGPKCGTPHYDRKKILS